MTEKDTYKTITKRSNEVLFKNKNSKFFGYAFPVKSEDEVKSYLNQLKKKHHAARHWCYAYKLGTETFTYRVNDDGEPNNSAGMPIYGQIQSFGVTNILVVVVRYFGGVKLGGSGLIHAYKTSSLMAIEVSKIIERTVNIDYLICFDYKNTNKVMRIIKENNLNIMHQKLELDCQITISVRKKDSKIIFDIFNRLFEIEIVKL